MPQIRHLLRNTVGHDAHLDDHFHSDPDRLRNEVIALTVTGQLSDMFEEMIMPLLKLKLRNWWRTYQSNRRLHAHAHAHTHAHASDDKTSTTTSTTSTAAAAAAAISDSETTPLVQSVREQATREVYNVQDDISEMVIQYGYLALFAPVWPLVSVGFLINNWIELRSDFLKLCTQHQRPHPVRTEGIGPWVAALDVLTWLGSISTAAIVHLFGNSSSAAGAGGAAAAAESSSVGYVGGWMRLLVTVFLSEHLYLLMRVAVGALLRRIGSEQVRREKATTFAFRRKYLDGLEVQGKVREALYGGSHSQLASSQQGGGYEDDEDGFWLKGEQEGHSREVGLALIRGLKSVQDSGESKRD